MKTGKWMLFIHPAKVNQVWNKIKIGIKDAELSSSKVTTSNPKKSALHAIMVYTKDYTDINDVVRVLDYLEKSDIKPKNKNIRYKTDAQTRAGIYSGHKERPWIYESTTVRSLLENNSSYDSSTTIITASDVFKKDANIELPHISVVKQKNKSIKLPQTSANLFQARKESVQQHNVQHKVTGSHKGTSNYFAILQEEADLTYEDTNQSLSM
jgi:hypothetical protein